MKLCGSDGVFGPCRCGDGGAPRADANSSDDAGDAVDGGRELTGKAECSSPPEPEPARWVAEEGAYEGAGTREDPWNLEKAADAAEPGDVVLFEPGTYEGTLEANSGTPEDPIVFRSAERHAANLRLPEGNSASLFFRDVSHVRAEGFRIGPGSGKWVYVDNSENIVLDDLWMEGHTGIANPIFIDSGEEVQLLNSTARRTHRPRLVQLFSCRRCRIAGNAFGLAPRHTLFANGSVRLVIRGNVFHNPGGRPAYIAHQFKQLVEDNLFANGVQGPGAESAALRLSGKQTIFRFNRVYRIWGSALRTRFESEQRNALNMRVYRNVFDTSLDRADGAAEGWVIRDGPGTLRDVVIRDNVFARHGLRTDQNRHVLGEGWGSEGPVRFENNAFWSGGEGPVELRVDGSNYGVEEANRDFSSAFENNRELDPGFTDPGVFDHRPTPGSPLVDAAEPLANTTSAGSGQTLPVSDAYPFYAPFDTPGERGDLIAVGEPGETARVVDRDVEAGELTLDRSLSWEEGERVDFPWAGEAPDAGRWEAETDSRRTVRIDVSKHVVEAGNDLTFRPTLYGFESVEPEEFRWQLGDGSRTCGRSFRHTYDEPGDYPVRLRVTDAEGRIHRATAHVFVRSDDVPADEISYNERLMEEYFCDGEAWFYTDDEEGRDALGRSDDGGYVCE